MESDRARPGIVRHTRIDGRNSGSAVPVSALTRIDLDLNSLTGEIPGELGNLSDLTHLYLHDNSLTVAVASSARLTLMLADLPAYISGGPLMVAIWELLVPAPGTDGLPVPVAFMALTLTWYAVSSSGLSMNCSVSLPLRLTVVYSVSASAALFVLDHVAGDGGVSLVGRRPEGLQAGGRGGSHSGRVRLAWRVREALGQCGGIGCGVAAVVFVLRVKGKVVGLPWAAGDVGQGCGRQVHVVGTFQFRAVDL